MFQYLKVLVSSWFRHVVGGDEVDGRIDSQDEDDMRLSEVGTLIRLE